MLTNSQYTLSLDSYLDIDEFLSLKDEFYYLYSKHHRHAVSTWTAGSIPADSTWEYFKQHPILYHTYHRNKEFNRVQELKNSDTEALARYLQLHFGAFNPYRILKLKHDNGDYKDFIDSYPIKHWANSLPFDRVDCIDLFYSDNHSPLGFHRDYNYFPNEDGDNRLPPNELIELIWFRFDLDRGFNIYTFDENGNIEKCISAEGYSITFDDREWHGNFSAFPVASLTVKVEGKFTEEFKKKIYG